ncbi:MAG: hypothetical protein ABL918_11140 [Chakrabartia sp.]
MAVNGRHNGRRIVLPVAILGAENPADLTHVRALALLDTGATVSGIGPRIIHELGLESHQKRRLVSATEIRFVDYYLFRIGLFAEQGDVSAQESSIPYIFGESDGFSWGREGDFEVILGMDILKQCEFSSDRSGQWALLFG